MRTCKNCKKKFKPQYNTTQLVCSFECSIEYSQQLRKKKEDKEWKERKKVLIEKTKTWSDYYQEALKVFNTYIRARDKNEPCISCDAPAGTYRITSGHYFPQGQNKSVALDEDNAHGQCWFNCNSSKSGNLSEYYPRLIKKIGQDRFDELERKKNTTKKYSIPELIEIKQIYKDKIKKIEKKL